MTQQNQAQAYVEINHQFDQLALVPANQQEFALTPMTGVERTLLERVGDEKVKRSTSIVRYAPESYFDWHKHPGGEEFLVLEGVFSDQTGDFPAGTYVRNPVGSSHKPSSKNGCVIMVKLSQIPNYEQEQLVIDTLTNSWTQGSQGELEQVLWQSELEQTSLVELQQGQQLHYQQLADVLEIFVIAGSVEINGKNLDERSWVRLPADTEINIKANDISRLYRKIGKGSVNI